MPKIARDALRPQLGIPNYFRVQRFCFGCIGVDPLSLERTYFNYFLAWIPLMAVFFCMFPVFYYAIQNVHDFDKATQSLSPFWQGFLSIFKAMYFMWNNRKMVALIRKLWSWNLEAKGAELQILAEENRKDILFSKYYHISVATTGVLALLAPFFIAGFYMTKGNKFWDYLEPPFDATYSILLIDVKTFHGYAIVYLWNLTGIYQTIYASVATDSLFSWFMCNIVAQFCILKHRISQAAEVNSGGGGASSRSAIKGCVAYHCRIIEISDEFNDFFKLIVFVKFIISAIQICCLGFQFSNGGELPDQVFQGFFLVSVSMQLMLYCYGGQRILDESESVANHIYASFHWEEMTIANKKMLKLSMMRAQRGCYLSGIFFVADLSLFLWVYRTAASFITMLWTLEENRQ